MLLAADPKTETCYTFVIKRIKIQQFTCGADNLIETAKKREKMKRQLNKFILLLTMAFMATSHAESESSSEFSMSFAPIYNFDLSAGGANVEVAYRPWSNSGWEFGLGASYLAEGEYDLEGQTLKHDYSNLKYFVGYAWKPIDMFDIKVSAGGASVIEDVEDTLIEQGETSAYVGLDLAFKLNDNWHIVNRFNYTIAHDNFVDSSSFGFGFKYTFGGSTSSTSSALNDDMARESSDIGTVAPPPALPEEEASPELTQSGNFENVVSPATAEQPVANEPEPEPEPEPMPIVEPEPTSYYSVQLGSFDKQASIEAYLNRISLTKADVFYRTLGAVIKLNTGKFDNRNQARNRLSQLKQQGINGFVVFVKE